MSEQLQLDERILKGIELGESHFREFKSAYVRDGQDNVSKRETKEICRDIAEALVSFSNADGGELFIGVEDDGTVTGIPHSDERVATMMQAAKSHVHPDTPLPPPQVKQIFSGAHRILYFRIEKGLEKVHLTADGRCLKRFDRGNRPVSTELIQLERREEKSREYDRSFVPNASVHDLNIGLIESIAQHLAPGFSPEKLIQFLGLGEYGPNGLQLRRAALLLFAKDILKWHPRCEVRIFRVSGNEVGSGKQFNVTEDETVRGNLAEILETGWDRLRPYLARTKFQPNALFRESIIYPEDACREALINAVAHRDYSAEGEPIEITVFDNRMEIRSPGRLLSAVTIEQLKGLQRAHESRNVYTARVLRELGYMREMGEGMRRIFSSIRRFDLVDPELKCEQGHFTVVLFHRSVFSDKDIQWLEGFSEFSLSKDEQRVILLGRDDRLLSTAEIMSTLGLVDTEDFRALFEDMRRKGLIYTARNVTGGGKRKLPRFRVRPPQEVKQFLSELTAVLAQIGPFERFERSIQNEIRRRLTPTSPFAKNPDFSIPALGFVDAARAPLPKLTEVWKSVSPKGVASDASEPRSSRIIGVVTNVRTENGYGFAKTDGGQDFYLHVYSFDHKADFDRIAVGDRVSFEVGARSTPGKAQEAKAIRLV